jgi:hypothetical protein
MEGFMTGMNIDTMPISWLHAMFNMYEQERIARANRAALKKR